MNYCMFGLVNVEYEHYDSIGKFFDECFEALGGKRVKEIGVGDDGDVIEEDYAFNFREEEKVRLMQRALMTRSMRAFFWNVDYCRLL